MLASPTAVLAIVPLDGSTSSSPTSSTAGVTPYIIPDLYTVTPNPGSGNRTCEDVGLAYFGKADYYQNSSGEAINYDEDANSFDRSFPAGLSVTVTDDTLVSFDSSFGIGAVIVKGGPNANVYVYDPQVKVDTGLASPPVGAQQNPAGLSNITFCWNPEPEPTTWCSPGFWRNNPLARNEAADAGNIDLSDPYNVLFDPDRSGNPSLLDVLLNPRTYGGAAGENVADLLSAADPRVNFELGDERVEDSCPIPADASRR